MAALTELGPIAMGHRGTPAGVLVLASAVAGAMTMVVAPNIRAARAAIRFMSTLLCYIGRYQQA
jgi:hypothetical protein